jgi:hypothetical protein
MGACVYDVRGCPRVRECMRRCCGRTCGSSQARASSICAREPSRIQPARCNAERRAAALQTPSSRVANAERARCKRRAAALQTSNGRVAIAEQARCNTARCSAAVPWGTARACCAGTRSGSRRVAPAPGPRSAPALARPAPGPRSAPALARPAQLTAVATSAEAATKRAGPCGSAACCDGGDVPCARSNAPAMRCVALCWAATPDRNERHVQPAVTRAR